MEFSWYMSKVGCWFIILYINVKLSCHMPRTGWCWFTRVAFNVKQMGGYS